MNEDDRLAECKEEDALYIESIQLEFAIPIYLTQAEQAELTVFFHDLIEKPYNQLKEGTHWHSFTGGRMSYSNVDAALLGKAPGPNPPPDGAEPDSDDTALVLESTCQEFLDPAEAERHRNRPKKKYVHVDEFIDDPFADKYARWILLHFRQPAHGMDFIPFLGGAALFCTCGGERYRVTMASRFGHIGLATDFKRDHGYDTTAHPNECTDWGPNP